MHLGHHKHHGLDSMAEFVETDPRNFDEDGSFINQVDFFNRFQ